jgi:signal transduction histidine kinase
MSLRGLLSVATGIILLLALTGAAALVTITTRMERNSARLWQALVSVRAAQEIEIALLTHTRESRLLGLTGEESHATELKEAEKKLRDSLREPPVIGSDEEATILQALTESTAQYLELSAELEAQGREALMGNHQLVDTALEHSKQLIRVNLDDARRVADETNRWDELANTLGLIVAVALLAGLGIPLWSIRRYLYAPLLAIRKAMVHFRPGGAGPGVPETGLLELREVAREFNEMAARLESQREQQLHFIAGVAHDLRNPLNALKLSASAVRPDQPLPPEQKVRERFALVLRQVDRIERMVGDLLDTARIEAGKLELHPDVHDLRGLLREAVMLHEGVSSAHPLVLQLPEEPVRVRCDATRITQVLNNLLSNAIKYSPRGGRVLAELTTTPDAAWVAVTDAGMGIPSAERESIFEPFRRSTATRDTIPGVGLGLAVSRRIIEAHGGHIEVQSKEAAGTTFRFRLPREP